jgi:hypothetical protein
MQRIVSIFFLILSVAYLVGSLSLPLGSARKPGPGILPLTIGIFLSFSSLLYFVKVFFLEKRRPEGKGGDFHLARFWLKDSFLFCFYGFFFRSWIYALTIILDGRNGLLNAQMDKIRHFDFDCGMLVLFLP